MFDMVAYLIFCIGGLVHQEGSFNSTGAQA